MSGGGLGNFWQKFILRKKGKDGGDASSSTERPLTREERNHLAAQIASSSLGLDEKAREQVAKAIEAQIRRLHEQREKRRRDLMETTQVQLPWGPKKEPEKPKHIPKPSLGASVYPIKFQMRDEAKAKMAKDGGKMAAEADTWDDSMWKPVAVGPTGPTLEEKRKAWLAKHGSKEGGSKKAPISKKVGGSDSSLSDRENETKVSASGVNFGNQPTAIQMDEEAVKEIHAHTLGKMLQNILVQAQTSQPKQGKTSRAAPSKKPQDMTPDELIQLRERDPAAWDQHTTQNTVISFGIVTPTDEDAERGRKTKETKRARTVTFDPETDVAKAPVGRDFKFNERLDRSTGSLKM